MIRRIPIFSTLIVIAAVATMIALGVWQLHRLEWKEALIMRYAQVETMSSDVACRAIPPLPRRRCSGTRALAATGYWRRTPPPGVIWPG